MTAQPREKAETEIPAEVVDLIGGGEWTRTTDLRIMSASTPTDNTEDQQHSSAENGEKRQNPQPPRNHFSVRNKSR
jgi:hypothetical protein